MRVFSSTSTPVLQLSRLYKIDSMIEQRFQPNFGIRAPVSALQHPNQSLSGLLPPRQLLS
jgi:hypothetical protein